MIPVLIPLPSSLSPNMFSDNTGRAEEVCGKHGQRDDAFHIRNRTWRCQVHVSDESDVHAEWGRRSVTDVVSILLYRYLSGDDETCRGKKGTGGVHLTKSNTSEICAMERRL